MWPEGRDWGGYSRRVESKRHGAALARDGWSLATATGGLAEARDEGGSWGHIVLNSCLFGILMAVS